MAIDLTDASAVNELAHDAANDLVQKLSHTFREGYGGDDTVADYGPSWSRVLNALIQTMYDDPTEVITALLDCENLTAGSCHHINLLDYTCEPLELAGAHTIDTCPCFNALYNDPSFTITGTWYSGPGW